MKPEKIDRYEIKSEVGRGGMASVYEAYDPRFERIVAVKVLPREFMHDPEFRARFTREAKVIASLEHPAIVPVYDFGEDNGQPFLVMRLMRGGSLTDRLAQGAIPFDETAVILKRLGSALDRAHSMGIVHRDLKPSNVLFDEYGDAYLADFGIVRVAASDDALTASGSLIGTPTYMSPEQVYGDKELDGRSDIYALGIILFQMLTGNTPYEADTPARMMMKHVMEPVPQIKTVRPDLPDEYENVITKALAKDRKERFPTGKEFSTAVTAITQKSSTDELAAELASMQADLLDDEQPEASITPESTLLPVSTPADELPTAADLADIPSPFTDTTPEPETDESKTKSSTFYEAAPQIEETPTDKLRVPMWVWAAVALLVIVCIVGISGIAWVIRQEGNPFASGDIETATVETSDVSIIDAAATTLASESTNTPAATDTAVPPTSPPPTDLPPTESTEIDADATRASLEETRAAQINETATPAPANETDIEGTRASLEETRVAETAGTAVAPRFDPFFGPTDGSLEHELNSTIKSAYADVNLQDFYMVVDFENPFGPEVGGWDFGLTFRQVDLNDELRIVVRSDGSWSLNDRNETEDTFIQEGNVSRLLNLDAGANNELQVIALGDIGYFFLNGKYADSLDLTAHPEGGDVAIGTGFYTSDMQEGAATNYSQYGVWTLESVFGPTDGSMEHIDDDLIKADYADVQSADFIAKTIFTNPYQADDETGWDYGFTFRDIGISDQYWLVITSDEEWALDHQTEEDDFYLQEESLENLNTNAGETNEVVLIAQNDVGYFFLNGEFISELNLTDRLEAGDMAVISAFYIGNERIDTTTDYAAWTIWELP